MTKQALLEALADAHPADGITRWDAIARELSAAPPDWFGRTMRISVLCSFTSDVLCDMIRVAAAQGGLAASVLPGPFGQLEQEVLRPSGGLGDVEPDVVILLGCWQDLVAKDGVLTPEEAAQRWIGLADGILERLQVPVIQAAFVPPAAGRLDRRGRSVVQTVRAVNGLLHERVNSMFRFADLDYTAASYGLRRWEDGRLWYAMRQPWSFDALPWAAAALAGEILALAGLSPRCLVLDLDDTLWGGVLGDDGPQSLDLGEGPRGEAFADFQRFLAGLTGAGMVLAVSSKNDRGLVLETLRTHPAMVLRPDDFVAIEADWDPKSAHLQRLSQATGLTTDHLLLIDDNPSECLEVRVAHPQARTLQLKGAPWDYPAQVMDVIGVARGYLTEADLTRVASYQGLAAGREARERVGSDGLENYLESLALRVTVQPLNDRALPRAAQMCAKTNQFNLTTKRYQQADLARLMTDANSYCATVSVEDRFADHGIVGLIVVTAHDDEAEVDTLLLSCRVIGRGVESALVEAGCQWASNRGCVRMNAHYRRTDRNAMTSDLYADLGFSTVAEGAQGRDFVLQLPDNTIHHAHWLEVHHER